MTASDLQHLLRLNAWRAVQDARPDLAAIISAGVAEGRSAAAIAEACDAIEPDEDVRAAVRRSIEYLVQEQA